MSDGKSLHSIQLLRAIAVLLVVHCHVLDLQLYSRRIALQQNFFYLQDFGAAGVDIFFVVSGFIITVISTRYTNGTGGLFFVKRIVRVVPLYWLVTWLIAMFAHFYWNNQYSFYSILTTLVFFPFLNPAPLTTPVLFQGWTLSFELLFYSLTTLALVNGRKKYMLFTALFFVVCIILRYAVGIDNVFFNFAGNGIMLEFILGVVAGQWYLSGPQFTIRLAYIIFFAGVAGFFISIIAGYNFISEAPATINGSLSLQRSLIWGLPSFMMILGLAMREKAGVLRIPFFWISIGNASYSIYLLHPFLLRFIYNRHFDISFHGWLPADLQVLLAMAFATFGGYLFYRWVERPFLHWLNGFLPANRAQKMPG